ncbi:hypothetical protein DFQ28_005428 [Apophysomyces sp. BC1034]|nr:hypothetical protein DFQ30_010961 [Apophysomyces sp. BC1015]KAG0182321.1 hypothetical protein DFQ29_004874 [Apophysomyces sp. BC1021]KAG0193424.1 hypothetical protein DFQ28_005428 [Apophysomyces sp. BC1034]
MSEFPIAYAEPIRWIEEDEDALAAYYAMICDEDAFPSLQSSRPAQGDWQFIKREELQGDDSVQHTLTPVAPSDNNPSNSWQRIDTMDTPYAQIAEQALDLPPPEPHRVFVLPQTVRKRKTNENLAGKEEEDYNNMIDPMEIWFQRKASSPSIQHYSNRHIRRHKALVRSVLYHKTFGMVTLQTEFDKTTPAHTGPVAEQQGKLKKKVDWLMTKDWRSRPSCFCTTSSPRAQLTFTLNGESELEKALAHLPEDKWPKTARIVYASLKTNKPVL